MAAGLLSSMVVLVVIAKSFFDLTLGQEEGWGQEYYPELWMKKATRVSFPLSGDLQQGSSQGDCR